MSREAYPLTRGRPRCRSRSARRCSAPAAAAIPISACCGTRELLRKGASGRVLPLEALPDDDLVGAVGGIGAPVVGIEKIEQGEECLRALCAPSRKPPGSRCRRSFRPRSAAPTRWSRCMTAAQAGLPVVDGDGMGRAFPGSADVDLLHLRRSIRRPARSPTTRAMSSCFKKIVDMYWLESFARHVAVDMGAGAGFATRRCEAPSSSRTAVPDTLTQALDDRPNDLECARRSGGT